MNNFVEALLNEIDCRKDYIDDKEVKTIYFGGGTPSLLPVCFIDKILDRINKIYNVSSKAEISLEVNPDTVNRERLMDYKTLGINRISVGIQSFFDDDLEYLSRKHDSKHALQLIDDLKAVDFEKLTLDLIYGIPTQTEEKWNKNLDIFFSTGITHLSAYALTVEPKTILGQKIKNGILKNVSEEDAVNHYRILVRRAKEEGFEHYEISNFAKPSYRSQHNSIYWNDEPYLGFGPSAHSYNGVSRQWNVSNLSQFINYMGMSDEIVEKEILSIEDKYNEYVKKFSDAIEDDLNTSNMVTLVYDVLKDDTLTDGTKFAIIEKFDEVLSLDLTVVEEKEVDADLEKEVLAKIEERKEAKKNKDFAKADAIRDELLARGIKLIDTREGTTYEIL